LEFGERSGLAGALGDDLAFDLALRPCHGTAFARSELYRLVNSGTPPCPPASRGGPRCQLGRSVTAISPENRLRAEAPDGVQRDRIATSTLTRLMPHDFELWRWPSPPQAACRARRHADHPVSALRKMNVDIEAGRDGPDNEGARGGAQKFD
jgi:hypothetical protein